MHQTIHAHHVDQADNYSTALRRWSQADPCRKTEPFEKWMGTSNQRGITIRCDGDGHPVRYRYHSTDIVTYHPDGRITLIPYNSASTDRLCDAILPSAIRVDYTHPVGLLIGTSTIQEGWGGWHNWISPYGKVFNAKAEVTLCPHTEATDEATRRDWVGGWVLETEDHRGRPTTVPFQWPVVDQKLLRDTYKAAGYPAFRAWVLARRAFAPADKESLAEGQRPSYMGDDAWMLARLEAKQYEMLWTFWTQHRGVRVNTSAEALCDALRKLLVKHVPEAITVQERPWLLPSELDAYVRATKTYGWALQ